MSHIANRPRVSIGIPLYAARPWVDRIVENIKRNAAPDVEFVLSDQHGLDDALDLVKARTNGAARLRSYANRTGAGWIDNYNLLLREATGDYVRILTQDDVLPAGSLDRARAALDADAETVVVVGPADLIDVAGNLVWRDVRLTASPARRLGWTSTLDAYLLFAGFRHHHANLALIRRAVLAPTSLAIPHTAGQSGLSVRVLLFGLALRGRVQYQPGYVSQRCVHPRSYTARHADRSLMDEWHRIRSYWQAGTAVFRGAATNGAARLAASPLLGVAAAHLAARRALERFSPQVRVIAAEQARERRDDRATRRS